ncbi:hypothetical protein BJV78DRAFT_1351448 [Lactifluus subvellereus]|nr:hypothetical protein BJV78DRAFT_1351448 [Lactifluus subvellereus]
MLLSNLRGWELHVSRGHFKFSYCPVSFKLVLALSLRAKSSPYLRPRAFFQRLHQSACRRLVVKRALGARARVRKAKRGCLRETKEEEAGKARRVRISAARFKEEDLRERSRSGAFENANESNMFFPAPQEGFYSGLYTRVRVSTWPRFGRYYGQGMYERWGEYSLESKGLVKGNGLYK